MKNISKLAAASLLVTSSFSVQAEVITIDFEDATSGVFGAVDEGYYGFDWDNAFDEGGASVAVIDAVAFTRHDLTDTGYMRGRTSGDYVAYNGGRGGPDPAYIDWMGSGTFDFISGYFTSAWNDTDDLTLEGWNNGTLVYSSDVISINDQAPTFVELNWTGIDRLSFSSPGSQWVMDDLTVAVVPEPSVLALMLGGLGLVGFMGARSRRNK